MTRARDGIYAGTSSAPIQVGQRNSVLVKGCNVKLFLGCSWRLVGPSFAAAAACIGVGVVYWMYGRGKCGVEDGGRHGRRGRGLVEAIVDVHAADDNGFAEVGAAGTAGKFSVVSRLVEKV